MPARNDALALGLAALSLGLVAIAGPASGAVYCRKVKGDKPAKPIVLRNVACKSNEADVTPEILATMKGPKGDQGDPGPRGDQGPPAPPGLGGTIPLTPAEALTELGAAYTIGGGPNVSGIAFSNSSFGRFHTGFTLPPDYAAGTDVTFRIMWANGNSGAVDCGFRLWANALLAYRPGTTNWAYIASGEFATSGTEQVTLAAGSTPQAVRAETLTIKGTGASASLQPGDALQIAIARVHDHAADTCTGSLVVVGIDATYQVEG